MDCGCAHCCCGRNRQSRLPARASRGGIAGLGEATTNWSPPVEERFPHSSVPEKQALQAGGGRGRGKGLLPLGSLPEPVTSLGKNLSLLFHAAWGIAGFSRLR